MSDQGHIPPDLNLEAVRAAFIGMTSGLLRHQVLAERSEFRASYGSEDLKKALGTMISSFAGVRLHHLNAVNS